jgi:hypothetical protein
MNLGNIKQTITSVIVSIFLSYILITTKDLLTIIIVIPFLLFGISFFIKNICIIFDKKKLAKIFGMINVLAFFLYYFGFIIYWDYMSIMNKDYISLICSLLPIGGGCFILYRRIKRYRK